MNNVLEISVIGRWLWRCTILGLTVIGLSACGPEYTGAPDFSASEGELRDADIVANSYQAAQRLIAASHQPIDREHPVLVASLVNVSNVMQSSNFGRIVSEQISSHLTQMGYEMRELKFRSSFLIKNGTGELVLSRKIKDIGQQQKAQAVVTGVYAVAKRSVYVTLRLLRAEDGRVISAYDYVLPLGPDTLALLAPLDLSGY